jgi:hypothetical protein
LLGGHTRATVRANVQSTDPRETTMSLMTRTVTSFAVLSLAAIPVAALTIKNTSTKEVSFAVDTGSVEAVYKVPAGGSTDVTQDCSSDCAVTGPWGYSRMVSQDATITTDGTSLVTAAATPPAPSLVPENPAVDPAESATEVPAPSADPAAQAPRKRYNAPRRQVRQATKGPTPGSLQMLMQGPGK